MARQGRFRKVLIVMSLLAWPAAASELYRYTNDQGVLVLDRHGVPAQFIGKGYEVLNSQGRVIRVVPPALSAEQYQRLQDEKAQAEADTKLLRLYAGVADVDRARQRKLAELDGLIRIAQGNQQAARNQQNALQAQAAGQERAGRPVPETLLTQIAELEREHQRLHKDIERYQRAQRDAEKTFADDRARIAALLGEG
ncbi:DUF4124 domain-containing protein [Pseudomonas sp. B392_1p]|uniref:DUF4124 domain-containing protein n=1 Tax=Pseudomonas sp. B392_1p TaxID=3457507 RepID=UPI003FD29FA2